MQNVHRLIDYGYKTEMHALPFVFIHNNYIWSSNLISWLHAIHRVQPSCAWALCHAQTHRSHPLAGAPAWRDEASLRASVFWATPPQTGAKKHCSGMKGSALTKHGCKMLQECPQTVTHSLVSPVSSRPGGSRTVHAHSWGLFGTAVPPQGAWEHRAPLQWRTNSGGGGGLHPNHLQESEKATGELLLKTSH